MKYEVFSELILTSSIQNILGGIIILNSTPPQEFCILMNVMHFSNFLLWAVYINMEYSNKLQAIDLIIYDPPDREKTKQLLTTIKID